MDNDTYVIQRKTPTDDERVDGVREYFKYKFNCLPEFIVKVPGRVNLIGEHVDYCGYPVLPMAIEQNILIAVSNSSDDCLHLVNVNSKYDEFHCNLSDFTISQSDDIDGIKKGPKWHNYFLCGIQGIKDTLPSNVKMMGMNVAVSGNIPPASGLSSSSALVCTATIAANHINQLKLTKLKLADIAAKCERYIGTQGGGMDQAIAFLAIEGCAQFIEWSPLRATPINLPTDVVFVIANTLSAANKAATSDFNQRVIECRLGCRILAKKSGLNWRDIDRFKSLQDMLGISLIEMEYLIDKYLPKECYHRNDIVNELDIGEQELIDNFLTPNTKHIELFKLRQRALHVLQESIRVVKFVSSAKSNNGIKELSKLMRQSHASLQELYECSHPNLDELVNISDAFGVAARLTGAGWGGCIVALCNSIESSQQYIKLLQEKYYRRNSTIDGATLNSFVFATSPQGGAEIYQDIVKS